MDTAAPVYDEISKTKDEGLVCIAYDSSTRNYYAVNKKSGGHVLRAGPETEMKDVRVDSVEKTRNGKVIFYFNRFNNSSINQ